MPQKPPLSMTVTWALPYDPREPGMPDTPFTRSLLEFVEGDDAARNSIFKLIPRCVGMLDFGSSLYLLVSAYRDYPERKVPALYGCAVAQGAIRGLALASSPELSVNVMPYGSVRGCFTIR